jgi:Pyridine nucleotide-disulphide oxidoreductase
VHYWASPLEAKLCARQEVALVGGGNSAGQAAVYLASHAAKVWLLVRGNDLAASMSRYLVDRIAGLRNVEVLTQTSVTNLEGHDGGLEAIRWRRGPSGEEVRRPIQHLFLFIGAEPNTNWLSGSGVALDAKGFVLTGADMGDRRRTLESSREGFSPSATCVQARSSGWRQPWARARKWWRRCTRIWPHPNARRPRLRTIEDRARPDLMPDVAFATVSSRNKIEMTLAHACGFVRS